MFTASTAEEGRRRPQTQNTGGARKWALLEIGGKWGCSCGKVDNSRMEGWAEVPLSPLICFQAGVVGRGKSSDSLTTGRSQVHGHELPWAGWHVRFSLSAEMRIC